MKLLSIAAAAIISLHLATAAVAQSNPDQPLPRKAWMGIAFVPLTPEVRKEKGLPETGGVLVAQAVPGGTAAAAGLKPDDFILRLGGQALDAPQQIGPRAAALTTGSKVTIDILRAGKPLTLEATLTPRPADSGDNFDTIYDHVVSNGNRIRTLVTRPKKPGKHPVMFLIQGIGYSSAEAPLAGPSPYSKILKSFNDKGFVTVRVDKPGLGDSEGGPAELVTFEAEMDAFRQALLKTKKYDFVDADNVFIFGHSMGGCQGPLLAAEIPVKGLAVYGTVVRPWHEYMVENTRRQATLAGADQAKLDTNMRQLMAAVHLMFNEGLTPAEAKEKHPQWAPGITAFSPDGKTMSGVGMGFWVGCFKPNYADAWTKVNTNVLSIWGESEFIAGELDHPLIAEIVNKANPGKGRYVSIKNSDHGFGNVSSPKESFEKWGKPGKELNLEIVTVLTTWVDALLKQK